MQEVHLNHDCCLFFNKVTNVIKPKGIEISYLIFVFKFQFKI